MYFTASTVAILALAAGSQAVPKKGEPPVLNHKAVAPKGTAVSSGTHPIMTGMSGGGNHTGGHNSTVTVTSSAPCFNCPGSSTIPISVPSSTPGSGSGSSGSGSSGSGSSGSGSSGSGSSGSGSSGSGSSGSGSSGAGGAGSGASGASGSSSGAGSAASPSSSGSFTPSNPGAKVAVPMAGVLGSVAYGLLLV
ncbi:uncharacterized protein PFLUO_LOCUS1411 [Penicillium psychrofluorescens]|uniref:uncharacterized protein n=1 Tax=Penicillium psychrofluorescens TaxID=3158075 RepID=UPI003CCD09BC